MISAVQRGLIGYDENFVPRNRDASNTARDVPDTSVGQDDDKDQGCKKAWCVVM